MSVLRLKGPTIHQTPPLYPVMLRFLIVLLLLQKVFCAPIFLLACVLYAFTLTKDLRALFARHGLHGASWKYMGWRFLHSWASCFPKVVIFMFFLECPQVTLEWKCLDMISKKNFSEHLSDFKECGSYTRALDNSFMFFRRCRFYTVPLIFSQSVWTMYNVTSFIFRFWLVTSMIKKMSGCHVR